MMIGAVSAVAVTAFEATVVRIEANIGQGLPGMTIVGLPDSSLREARERVRAAITNSGGKWPEGRVVVGLAPAALPKTGSSFDLALALSILGASGLQSERFADTVFIGELGLDGKLRAVRGVLPAVIAARDAGKKHVVVPPDNAAEAVLVPGIEVGAAHALTEVMSWLAGDRALDTVGRQQHHRPARRVPDLADVAGQEDARFALEVAAAGAHHLFMTGPPGIGKTMLARRLPGILPPLTVQESLEVTAIHSIAGVLTAENPLVTDPPFVAPHHSTTVPALTGGGTGIARPGAVSRAHRGVLFIDECAEASTAALESLREPLEDGFVRVPRRDGTAEYPARFQLVLAANPCPCAPAADVDCVCPPAARRRYLGKLSGPLMDRVDIRVRMDPPGQNALMSASGEPSAVVRARVISARAAAADRWAGHGFITNAEVPGPLLRHEFRLPAAVRKPIEMCLRDGRVTARGADRATRVAWTLADLRGGDSPSVDDVAQALLFRERSL